MTRKTRPQTSDTVSAYLCNFLPDHGVKLVKVLKKAGFRPETPADWHSGDVVYALYMASLPLMSQTLHTDSEAASDDNASDKPSTLDWLDNDKDLSFRSTSPCPPPRNRQRSAAPVP